MKGNSKSIDGALERHPHPSYPPPHPNLYIYLFKGVLGEKEEALLGPEFIGNWVEEGSSFLFFSRPPSRVIADLLHVRPDLELEDRFHFTYEDWQGGGLEPLVIGPFLIVPPWHKGEIQGDLIPILLDPGVVFGNCLHPTTSACLKAIALASEGTPLKRVLDLGTGTGVLALAAAHMGAHEVLAVDLNPLCVKTARRNVRLNHLEQTVRVLHGKAEDASDNTADVIVANIHYEVITELLNTGMFCNAGTIIISGLLRSQYSDIKDRMEHAGFLPTREWDHEMTWFTVLAVREPST